VVRTLTNLQYAAIGDVNESVSAALGGSTVAFYEDPHAGCDR
jgi:hypothetical protein